MDVPTAAAADPISIAWSLAAVAALVFANGFFVAAEFALVTIRATKVEELVAEGVAAARAVRVATLNLDRYIAGTQIGITLASLGLGWIGEPALARLIGPFFKRVFPDFSLVATHSVAVGISFTIVTFLHVILGELVPKSLALQKPEATSLAVARPMIVVVTMLRPLIWSLNGIGNMLLRVLGLRTADGHASIHSAQELELLVRQSHEAGELDDLERRMLQRTFRFSETTVGDIMVPRSEMTGLDLTEPLETLLDEISSARHTRLPCYEESIDKIIGVVYLHDVFRMARLAAKTGTAADVKSVVRKPLFVPESYHLDAMIDRFRKERMQIAIVVDEYGGTAGLVTLEDIVESVFGELQDQNESSKPQIAPQKDGSILVRGDTRLVELKETIGWSLIDEESDTIAGYVMSRLGRMPKVGDHVDTPHGSVRVVAKERQRITEVVLRPAK